MAQKVLQQKFANNETLSVVAKQLQKTAEIRIIQGIIAACENVASSRRGLRAETARNTFLHQSPKTPGRPEIFGISA